MKKETINKSRLVKNEYSSGVNLDSRLLISEIEEKLDWYFEDLNAFSNLKTKN